MRGTRASTSSTPLRCELHARAAREVPTGLHAPPVQRPRMHAARLLLPHTLLGGVLLLAAAGATLLAHMPSKGPPARLACPHAWPRRYPVPTEAETQGRTDKYIGTWLKSRKRDSVVLATKVRCGAVRGSARAAGSQPVDHSLLRARFMHAPRCSRTCSLLLRYQCKAMGMVVLPGGAARAGVWLL